MSDYTVAIACVILVGLSALQYSGTHRVGFPFTSILLAWLSCLARVDIYNIFHWNPGVIRGLSPYYICNLFQKKGKKWMEFTMRHCSLCYRLVARMKKEKTKFTCVNWVFFFFFFFMAKADLQAQKLCLLTLAISHNFLSG